MEIHKRLHRSASNRVIAGVAGGLGEYFETDALVFRVLFLLLLFMGGGGILLYVILMFLMPGAGEHRADVFTDVSQRVQEIAAEMKEHRSMNPERRRATLGILVVIAGLLLLISQILPGMVRWDIVGPLVVIAIGVILISRHRR